MCLRLEIQRDNHIEYLINGLRNLGPSFVVLDAKYVVVLSLSHTQIHTVVVIY